MLAKSPDPTARQIQDTSTSRTHRSCENKKPQAFKEAEISWLFFFYTTVSKLKSLAR